MKNLFSIATTLIVGLSLSVAACGKDKKPATTEPAATAPAATDPAKPADPAAPAAPAEEKKADAPKGGW
jgi:hypothetical protein